MEYFIIGLIIPIICCVFLFSRHFIVDAVKLKSQKIKPQGTDNQPTEKKKT